MLGERVKYIHCIGIGGIGVSAIAEILLTQGYQVTGSDAVSSPNTERLIKLGARIAVGHSAQNITNPDRVVYSSAIAADNPELVTAKKNKIPLILRGELLSELINTYRLVTVAGTHGKTTTTGLIAHLLTAAGKDPSYVIGGILKGHVSPVRVGKGEYCIAEVDESDASFLYMKPQYAVITNIDADHLEAYRGDFEELKNSFIDYLLQVPSQGAAIVCIDDPIIRSLLPRIKCRLITYGFSEQAQVRACYFHQEGVVSEFSVRFLDAEECVSIKLNLPGQHNVLNALACVALAKELGIATDSISQAMQNFPGVGRRFHDHGQMQLACGSASIFEDYGHHPKEIRATLNAAKNAWPNRRVVLVFQPHRYTRTRDLYHEFIEALKEVDKLYLVDIYSAGEQPLENISSMRLVEEIRQTSGAKAEYISDLASLPEILYKNLQDQDVVILQGAGSIGAICKQLSIKHE